MFNELFGAVRDVAKVAAPFIPYASSALSFLGGRQRNEAQTAAANAQMAFQERMSNTSYRRAMADMRAAGLNPMLAARLGGASSPGGAMPALSDVVTPAMQTFNQSFSAQATASLQEHQEKVAEQTAGKIAEEIKNVPEERERIKQAAYMLYQQAELMIAQKMNAVEINDQIKATISKLVAETGLLSNQAAAEASLDNLGREMRQLQPIIDLLKPFIGRR